MSFMDHLSDAWDSVKDGGEAALGVAMDTAKMTSAVVTAEAVGAVHARSALPQTKAATDDFRNSTVGRFKDYVSQHRGTTGFIGDQMSQLAQGVTMGGAALQYGINKAQRGFTTWQLLNGDQVPGQPGDGGVPGTVAGLFNGSVGKAWDMSNKATPFQSFNKIVAGKTDVVLGDAEGSGAASKALGINGSTWDNIAQYGERGNEKFSPAFSWASGTMDAAFVWYADPLVLAGKASIAARTARTVLRPGDLKVAEGATTGTRRQKKVAGEVQNFAEQTVGKPMHELMRYKAFSDSTQGAALASLMSAAKTPEQGRLIWLTAQGSTEAKAALVAQRADLGFKIDRMQANLDKMILPPQKWDASGNPVVEFATNNGPDVTDPFKSEIAANTATLDMFDRAVGDQEAIAAAARQEGVLIEKDQLGVFASTAKRAHVSRVDRARADRSSSYVIQDGLGGVPIRVMRAATTRRPHGGFDTHDAEAAFEEVDRLTKQARGLDPAVRNEMLDRVIKAPDDNSRKLTVDHIVDQLINHAGAKYGYDPGDVQKMLSKMRSEQTAMVRGFTERNYGFREDGSIELNPLSETQLANWAPTVDLSEVHRVLRRNSDTYQALKLGHQAFDVTEHFFDQVNDLWKLNVLFRAGYLGRNVLDNQLRIVAVLHAREAVRQHGETIKGRASYQNAYHQIAKANPKMDHAAIKLAAQDRVAAANPTFRHGSYDVAQPYGKSGDEARFNKKQIGSVEEFSTLAANFADSKLNELRGSGDWITRGGNDPRWGGDYLSVVNQHLRQGEISRRLLAGDSPATVKIWLKSADGRALRRRLVHGHDSVDDLVQANLENLNHAIPDREMWPVFSQREATEGDVHAMWGNSNHRPDINAAQVAFSMGRGKVADAYNNLKVAFFKYANSIPDDVMGRHPMYRALYRGRMRQELHRLDPKLEGTLTDVEQRTMEEQSRLFARREMKRLMFDASNQSNLGHFLRFTSPFYTAWEDVLHKYGRMVMADPTLIPHAWQVWSAPNDAGFMDVVDSQTGKPVTGENSKLTSQEMLVMPAGYLTKYFGVSGARISKGGFNVVLQGDPWYLPGAGPMAQAAVQDLAVGLDNPTVADAATTLGILPFGVQDQGKFGLGYFKSGVQRNMTLTEATRGKLRMMILTSEQYKYQTGDRDTPPTPGEINRKTNNLIRLRQVTSFLTPASVQYTSPYQFYIDQYHSYVSQVGPHKKYKTSQDADAAFQAKNGDDLYLFSTSLADNKTGVGPSKQAYAMSKKYKDLIAEHQDFGWYFVGPDNNGDFNKNVYGLQSMKAISPTSSRKFRDTYEDPFQAVKDNHAEVGWIEYQKMSARLEAIRIQRGLPSMDVKDAQDLRAKKAQWLAIIQSKDGPGWGKDWYDDYLNRDGAKTLSFLRAGLAATKNPDLAKRGDVQAMALYLKGRASMQKVLAARKAAGGSGSMPVGNVLADGSISYGQSPNADIAQIWAQFGAALKDYNVTFADTYERYLDRDTLEGTP